MAQLAKQYENEPIVFIAVNSGTAPGEVASYAKKNGVAWPIIVDPDRSFEQAAGLPEISLRNVTQVKIVTGDGTMRNGDWSDPKKSVDAALSGAKWKYDLQDIPASLSGARKAIEFGYFNLALNDINRASKSKAPAEKDAAKLLETVVLDEVKKKAAAAWELGQQKKYYEAHKAFVQIQTRYAGYDIPDTVAKAEKWLGSQDAVRAEIRAVKILDGAKEFINSPRQAVKSRAITQLKNVVSRFPETEAAQEAKRLLAEAGGTD